MPARTDCEKTLLLKQQAKLQQLQKMLLESEIIEPGAQNYVLDQLRQSEFASKLEAEAQERLRSKPSLKQLRQESRLAFKVTTAPTQKLDQIEALWFSSPYVEARFQILRGWVNEVFRILVDEIWQGRPTAKQVRDAKDEIILPLIRLEENNFKHAIRTDVLTDCLAFQVEFPEVQFRVREQDFMRLTAQLTEKWKTHIEAMAWKAEQRTPVKTEESHVEAATPSVAMSQQKQKRGRKRDETIINRNKEIAALAASGKGHLEIAKHLDARRVPVPNSWTIEEAGEDGYVVVSFEKAYRIPHLRKKLNDMIYDAKNSRARVVG